MRQMQASFYVQSRDCDFGGRPDGGLEEHVGREAWNDEGLAAFARWDTTR